VEFRRVETQEAYLAALESFWPDIIISDFKLPLFDGMRALKIALERAPDTPFIISTGSTNEDTAVECMKAGAWDYVIKEHIKRMGPAVISALEQKKVRLEKKLAAAALKESEEKYRCLVESTEDLVYLIDKNLHVLYANRRYLERHGLTIEELSKMEYESAHSAEKSAEFKEQMRKVIDGKTSITYEHKSDTDGKIFIRTLSPVKESDGNAIEKVTVISKDITKRKKAEERLQIAFGSIIRVIAGMVEKRDPYTAGHQKRVSELAWAIACEMGMTLERADTIRTAGIIHDLGKIVIPSEILSKPSMLSEFEFSLLKTHPTEGYDILRDIEFPGPVARIVLEHHERMNGSGYPNGLKDGEILQESKILIVADVIEAMASHRPYRPAQGIDKALAEIEKDRGTLYDSEVVDVCLRLFREKKFAWGQDSRACGENRVS
jgi:PAS domain S-box-containing protein/putative nucleotidyltransferase with HDIG domain